MGFWDGSGISWTVCKKSAPRSRQTATPTPRHSIFYRPDALPDAQPTASKYWRHKPKAIDRYILPTGRSAVNLPTTAADVNWWERQTDGWTPDPTLHITWAAPTINEGISVITIVTLAAYCTVTNQALWLQHTNKAVLTLLKEVEKNTQWLTQTVH